MTVYNLDDLECDEYPDLGDRTVADVAEDKGMDEGAVREILNVNRLLDNEEWWMGVRAMQHSPDGEDR